MFNNLSQLT